MTRFSLKRILATQRGFTPHVLQSYAMRAMLLLVFLSFASVNLQALLWQTSDWLVGSILPAVVVDLTNEERQSSAADPLRRNAKLDEAARLKAEHMAKEEYFAHFSPTGVTPWHWFKEAGYLYAHAGENLAIHFSDSQEVVTAWMNSPTHRDNIVDPKYQEIGVGTARGKYQGYETVFVVQLFGTPAAPAQSDTNPLPIISTDSETGESLATTTANVTDSDLAVISSSSIQVAGASELSANVDLHSSSSKKAEVFAVSSTEPNSTKTATPTPIKQEADIVSANAEMAVATSDETYLSEASAVEISDESLISIYSGMITTSTPLQPATIESTLAGNAGTSAPILGRLATQPNTVLQILYLIIGSLVGLALFTSILLEWRRHHPVQVAYGVLLLFVMSGLFYFHTLLTGGAVIV